MGIRCLPPQKKGLPIKLVSSLEKAANLVPIRVIYCANHVQWMVNFSILPLCLLKQVKAWNNLTSQWRIQDFQEGQQPQRSSLLHFGPTNPC